MKYKYITYPVDKLTEPPTTEGTFDVYQDRWWAVADGKVYFYRGFSPQCNRIKAITERFSIDGAEAVFLPIAYVPVKWTNEGMEINDKQLETEGGNDV